MWRPEKVSIGDQMETTFGMKRRPFGDHFKGNWRPLAKLSVVSIIMGSKNLRLLKMTHLFQNCQGLSQRPYPIIKQTTYPPTHPPITLNHQ